MYEESQTQRSQSVWPAGKRTTPRKSTSLESMTSDGVEDDEGASRQIPVDPDVGEECRICKVIQTISGMNGIPREQRPRINAALLSMVQGLADAVGPRGMDSSGILEAMGTLSQVGLSQASTESYYPKDEDGCRVDPELDSPPPMAKMGA